MYIWHRRPLFRICTALIVGISAGYLSASAGLPTVMIGLILLGLCVSAGIAVAVLRRRSVRFAARLAKPCLRAAGLCALAVLAVLWSGVFVKGQVREDSFPSVTAAKSAPDGPVWTVSGRVTERLSGGGQITVFGLTLDSVNGKSVGSRLCPCRAVLSCGYASDVQPGYAVTVTARAVPLAEAAGYRADSLTADGYTVGLLSDAEADCLITDEAPAGLRGRLDALRRRTAARLDVLVGGGGYGLPSALLLGERGGLDQSVQRDFRRSGVSHLLAISGLHMTMLFGLLSLLMSWLTVPKRVRAVVLLLLSTAYLTFLGFMPSAARAVVMLGAVCLSWLWSAAPDSLTALGCAGALILTVNPCTAADVGFWMSFSATLGLVAVMPLFRLPAPGGRKDPTAVKWRKAVKRKAASALAGVGAGIVAMSFSLWVTAPVFGSVSLWSPAATVLLTPLCGFVLVASLLLLPLSGTALGQYVLLPAVRAVCGWMARLTAAMSDASFGVLSLRDGISTVIILLMTAALLLLLGVKLPRGKRALVCLPVICGWALLIGAVWVSSLVRANEVAVTYRQTSASSEALILRHGQGAVICDLSDGSRTAMNQAVRQAEADGATEVSALILTHYHSRMSGTLYHLFASEKVRLLYVPRPATANEWYLMQSVLDQADYAGVPVRLFDAGGAGTDAGPLTLFGGVELCLYTDRITRSTQPVLLLSVAAGTERLLYAGSALSESRLSDTADRLSADSDTVIFGHHGPLFKQSYGCPDGCRAAMICFGSEEAAAWFDSSTLPDAPPVLLIGSWRGTLNIE